MDLRLATLSRVKYTKDNAWPDSFYPVKAGAILEVDPVRLDGILESTYGIDVSHTIAPTRPASARP